MFICYATSKQSECNLKLFSRVIYNNFTDTQLLHCWISVLVKPYPLPLFYGKITRLRFITIFSLEKPISILFINSLKVFSSIFFTHAFFIPLVLALFLSYSMHWCAGSWLKGRRMARCEQRSWSQLPNLVVSAPKDLLVVRHWSRPGKKLKNARKIFRYSKIPYRSCFWWHCCRCLQDCRSTHWTCQAFASGIVNNSQFWKKILNI